MVVVSVSRHLRYSNRWRSIATSGENKPHRHYSTLARSKCNLAGHRIPRIWKCLPNWQGNAKSSGLLNPMVVAVTEVHHFRIKLKKKTCARYMSCDGCHSGGEFCSIAMVAQ